MRGSPSEARSAGTVTWTTNAEGNLRGFNIIEATPCVSRRLNALLIECGECTTGLGHAYAYDLPKHRSGRNLYIESVHLDGSLKTFGPAVVEAAGVEPEPPPKS